MLDLIIITCFVVVVGLVWVFSNMVKTAKSLRKNLQETNAILITLSADIDNVDKQMRDLRNYLENNL